MDDPKQEETIYFPTLALSSLMEEKGTSMGGIITEEEEEDSRGSRRRRRETNACQAP